jgi:phosphomannomutase
MGVLDEIVKAYDVRGTVPDQLNEAVARALGVAFARYAGGSELLVGRDMRPTGPALVEAFTGGVRSQGVDVVRHGLDRRLLCHVLLSPDSEVYEEKSIAS